MEISKVETFACLVPKIGKVNNSSASKGQSIIASPADEEGFYIYLNDDDQERIWNVSQSTTPEINQASITDITRCIELALTGYDANILMISKEDSPNLYKQRKTDIETMLHILDQKLQSSNQPTQIEYAYLGLTDEFVYDLRKDAHYSNDTYFEKGLDAFMKKVDSVADVRDKIKRGSKLAFVLSIRLTNLTTNTQGNLQVVDLLRPPFSVPSTRDNRSIYRSFSNLLNMVHKLLEPNFKHTSLGTGFYVLPDLLSKSLAGRTKFSVYAYFTDQVQENDMKDTVATFNLLVELGQLPISRMIQNSTITKSVDFRKMKAKALELASKNTELEQESFALESLLKVRNAQVNYLEAAQQELLHRPSKTEFDLKAALSYQRGQDCMLDFKTKNLQLDLKYQLDINQSLREQLGQSQQLQSDYAAKIEQLESVHAAKIEQLENAHTAKIQQVESDQAAKTQEIQRHQAAEIQQLQSDQSHQQSTNDLQYEDQIKQLNQELQTAVTQNQEMEETIQKNAQELYSEYKRKITSLKHKHKMQIDALKEEYDDTVRTVQDKERKRFESYRDLREVKLKNEIVAITNQMTGAVAELKREWKKMTRDEKPDASVGRQEEEDEEEEVRLVRNKPKRRKPNHSTAATAITPDREEEQDTRSVKNRTRRRNSSDPEAKFNREQVENEDDDVGNKIERQKPADVTATTTATPPKKKRGRPSKKEKALLSSQVMEASEKDVNVLEEAEKQEVVKMRSEQEKEHVLEEQPPDEHQELEMSEEEIQIDQDNRIEDIQVEDFELEENHPEEIKHEGHQPEENRLEEKEISQSSPPPHHDDDDDFMEEPKIVISHKPKTKRKPGRPRKSSAATSPTRSRRKRRDLSSINEDTDDVVDIISIGEEAPVAVDKEDDDNDMNRSPVLGSTTPYRQSPPPPQPLAFSTKKQPKKRRKLQPTQQSSQHNDNYWADSNALSPFSQFLRSNNVIAENKRKKRF